MNLFGEFVKQRMADAPSQQINGLDREFAAQIEVNNTYFSGMKSGARTIGEKLARQIEVHCNKGRGWLDEFHDTAKPTDLKEFLQLAEKAFVGAPQHARKYLAQVMRDVLATKSENISSNA
ncbi:MAG: hypothetical protein ACOYNZ_04260 [Rhodoferax sp.]